MRPCGGIRAHWFATCLPLPVAWQYIDAIRLDDLPRFRKLEQECREWWFPTLDRGAGAALHCAADHGRLEAARYLLEARGVEVNQRDIRRGWTPLMRCARVAHDKDAPHQQVGSGGGVRAL